MAALLHLFQQQLQQAADQRSEDRREAAAREDCLEAQRREDRREAAEREARLEARLLHTHSTTAIGYRIGAAAKKFRACEGKEDGAAYILELTHLLGTHEVPVAHSQRAPSLRGVSERGAVRARHRC